MITGTSTSGRATQDRTIVIEGQRIGLRYRELPPAEVRLDARNPRINYQQRKEHASADELRDFVLTLHGVSDLVIAIRENGGLIEPIIVDHRYRVIEGNCRAAVLHKLHAAKPTDPRWRKIPAHILPATTTPRQIAVLQGMYHVNGKIPWRAYLQAAHLHDMQTRLRMSMSAIAKSLGLQERVVDRLLSAYAAMSEHMPQVKRGKGMEAFAYFEEFYKNGKLKEYRCNPRNVATFAKLVETKRLPHGRHVRDLPAIIVNPCAFKKLASEGHKAAMDELGTAQPSMVYPLFKQVKHTRDLLNNLQQHELLELREHSARQHELRELFHALRRVFATVGFALGSDA